MPQLVLLLLWKPLLTSEATPQLSPTKKIPFPLFWPGPQQIHTWSLSPSFYLLPALGNLVAHILPEQPFVLVPQDIPPPLQQI